jgi:hypothetical protein
MGYITDGSDSLRNKKNIKSKVIPVTGRGGP